MMDRRQLFTEGDMYAVAAIAFAFGGLFVALCIATFGA